MATNDIGFVGKHIGNIAQAIIFRNQLVLVAGKVKRVMRSQNAGKNGCPATTRSTDKNRRIEFHIVLRIRHVHILPEITDHPELYALNYFLRRRFDKSLAIPFKNTRSKHA